MAPDPSIIANAEGIDHDLKEAREAAQQELAKGEHSQ